ncbi:hypothetical protein B0H10DRAFT_1975534 [Mycena sp. CBHHK59/15]|nr:hypothetical protein B0H10DRAFT_1975534 [Mycena sp. CBHHK59/15]
MSPRSRIMPVKRLKYDSDDGYVPPTPKKPGRKGQAEAESIGVTVASPTKPYTPPRGCSSARGAPGPDSPSQLSSAPRVSPSTACVPSTGFHNADTSPRLGPRPPMDNEANEVVCSRGCGYTRLTCDCCSPFCANASQDTPFYCEGSRKVVEAKPREDDDQGGRYKDLQVDDYFQSVFQFEGLLDYP